MPLVHVAFGRDADGKLRVARGVIAVGQFAVGVVTLAQFGVGLVFGFGQLVLAPLAVGQAALGLAFGLGQIATGRAAIGQLAAGQIVLAQIGWGIHLWTPQVRDPTAVEFFHRLYDSLVGLFSS